MSALTLSLPGTLFIILSQNTVFGTHKRGDYNMLNKGTANPYESIVYMGGRCSS